MLKVGSWRVVRRPLPHLLLTSDNSILSEARRMDWHWSLGPARPAMESMLVGKPFCAAAGGAPMMLVAHRRSAAGPFMPPCRRKMDAFPQRRFGKSSSDIGSSQSRASLFIACITRNWSRTQQEEHKSVQGTVAPWTFCSLWLGGSICFDDHTVVGPCAGCRSLQIAS